MQVWAGFSCGFRLMFELKFLDSQGLEVWISTINKYAVTFIKIDNILLLSAAQ